MFDEIAFGAARESRLWADALLPGDERQPEAVFSELAPPEYELGFETVYEAYLVHYGRPRLFAPAGESERILLGDYLYAHGLVHIAQAGGVEAVATMADLISHCAAMRAVGDDGDGDAWVVAARSLGGAPESAEVEQALARHLARVAVG